MAFKAQVSFNKITPIKEKRSVLFIENLLVDKANTDISTEDKKANIDGYIELLSSDKRIVGKITVQVKTVPSKYEGKNSYPCPTSLFAYAESTTDVVYLLAVDHSQSKVLFKHISYASSRIHSSSFDATGSAQLLIFIDWIAFPHAIPVRSLPHQPYHNHKIYR